MKKKIIEVCYCYGNGDNLTEDLDNLTKRVNEKIEEGFVPIKRLRILRGVMPYQFMVKYVTSLPLEQTTDL